MLGTCNCGQKACVDGRLSVRVGGRLNFKQLFKQKQLILKVIINGHINIKLVLLFFLKIILAKITHDA